MPRGHSLTNFLLLSICISQFIFAAIGVGTLIYIATNEHTKSMLVKLDSTLTRVDNISAEIRYVIVDQKLIETSARKAFEFIDQTEQIMTSAQHLVSNEGLASLTSYMLETQTSPSALQAYNDTLASLSNVHNITSLARHLAEDIERNHEEIPKAYAYMRENTNYTDIMERARSLYEDIQEVADMLANFQGITFIDGRKKKGPFIDSD